MRLGRRVRGRTGARAAVRQAREARSDRRAEQRTAACRSSRGVPHIVIDEQRRGTESQPSHRAPAQGRHCTCFPESPLASALPVHALSIAHREQSA